MARLQKHYNENIMKQMNDKFKYKNVMEIPKIKKIVLSMGVGKAINDSKLLQNAHDQLKIIAAQKPVITKARSSIAGFKLREGMPIGVKVTLRKKKMYEFMDRLINIALPRTKDFNGFKTNRFDGNRNFSFGIKEHIIFPEATYDTVDNIMGLNVTVEIDAKTDEEAIELMRGFHFPFIKQKKEK